MIPLTQEQMKRKNKSFEVSEISHSLWFEVLKKCLVPDCLRFCSAEISNK